MREGTVPANVATSASHVEGRELTRAVVAGAMFVNADFVEQDNTLKLAELVPEGRVLTSVRISSAAMPPSNLQRGDRLAILVNGDSGPEVVASDAFFVGHLAKNAPPKPKNNSVFGIDLTPPGTSTTSSGVTRFLLALLPEDVFPLVSAEGSFTIVLHSRSSVASGEMLALQPSRGRAGTAQLVELLVGGRRASRSFVRPSDS